MSFAVRHEGGAMKRYVTITGMVVCLLGVTTLAQASTHHPKGITEAQAAKQYLADVAPANALPQSTKPPAYAAAVHKLDTLLLSQRWPSGTRADIRALVVADAAVVGDFNTLSEFQHSQRVSPQRQDPEGHRDRYDRCQYCAVRPRVAAGRGC